MNTKAWLMRVRNIDREIDGLLEQRHELYSRLTNITQKYTGDGVQSNKDPHKYDSLAVLDGRIEESINGLVAAKAEVEGAIASLEDGRYREILRLRYLSGKSFEEIAVKVRYSYKQTCRLHGRALLKLEEVLNERV